MSLVILVLCKDYPFSPTGGLYAQSWLEVEHNRPRVGETELITTVQVAFHTRLTHLPYQILIVIISCIISISKYFGTNYLPPA